MLVIVVKLGRFQVRVSIPMHQMEKCPRSPQAWVWKKWVYWHTPTMLIYSCEDYAPNGRYKWWNLPGQIDDIFRPQEFCVGKIWGKALYMYVTSISQVISFQSKGFSVCSITTVPYIYSVYIYIYCMGLTKLTAFLMIQVSSQLRYH